jgi:hypothetical protein
MKISKFVIFSTTCSVLLLTSCDSIYKKQWGAFAERAYQSTYRQDSIGLICLDTMLNKDWDSLYQFFHEVPSSYIAEITKDKSYTKWARDMTKGESRWIFTKQHEVVEQLEFNDYSYPKCSNPFMGCTIEDNWFSTPIKPVYHKKDIFFVINKKDSDCKKPYVALYPFKQEMEKGDSSKILKKLSKFRVDSLKILYKNIK